MFKRIFAGILAALLIGMYVLTLILGLMQDPKTTDLLMASIGATILVPIMLYAYQRIYALIHPHVPDEDDKKQ
jgi:putative hydrolase of the HAD superfamily